jgi:hypothetical protein
MLGRLYIVNSNIVKVSSGLTIDSSLLVPEDAPPYQVLAYSSRSHTHLRHLDKVPAE